MLIRVFGTPAPQGSKRHVGRGVMIESSKKVKPWREAVKYAAIEARAAENELYLGDGPEPYDWPAAVSMVFTFARPKSHYRTGRNARLLRDSAPAWPASIPDLSKLARSTEDALTDAGIWRDDALVVTYDRLAKVYASCGDPDALDVPGAVIRIRPAFLNSSTLEAV